jgi:hypothetical protein
MTSPNLDGCLARSPLKMISPFFIVTPTSRLVPLAKIFPREAPDPTRVRRAHALMSAAAQGAIPKRHPLAVMPRGDNCYQIVEGNSTYHALIELGEQAAVVELIQ